MTEHKWARIICAMAAGKKVEYKSPLDGEWQTPFDEYVNPISLPELEWRIKPTEQEKPRPTPHLHAAKMAEYAQDAAIDGEAWRNWEFRFRGEEQWEDLTMKQAWLPECEYRRKPEPIKMIKVTLQNGKVVEFPEPLRVAPANGTRYYVADIMFHSTISNANWESDSLDVLRLSRGLCHVTREAAEQHAAALLAVNRGE